MVSHLPAAPLAALPVRGQLDSQNRFGSQSVTNVVLFEICEDNMVPHRPEEEGIVKAVLDDGRVS